MTWTDTIRILKPGGIVGFTTFQQGSVHRWWHGELRDAFPTFPFEAPFPDDMPMQLHSSGNWVDRKAVEEHLTANYSDELVDVEVKNVVGRYTFQQPEEWLLIFENMVGWLTSGWWSEETRQAHPADEVKELMLKHLTEKYQGKPWEVSWELICATARLRE